jgi:hypothetical protein
MNNSPVGGHSFEIMTHPINIINQSANSTVQLQIIKTVKKLFAFMESKGSSLCLQMLESGSILNHPVNTYF